MNGSRDRLIASLVADARPIAHPGRVARAVSAWLAVATAVALAGMALRLPFGTVRWAALAESPRFLLECLCGVGVIVTAAVYALRSALPAALTRSAAWTLPLVLLATWLAWQILAITMPAIAPDMAGKRPHCWLEVLLAGMPGLVIGLGLARRLWPLAGTRTGALAGLAAGAIPALAMQLVCQYEPVHGLAFHLAPGVALGILGALAGARWLRPRG
ncbi:MAG: NrsF family protein [Gammaproteobacteria bacterium]